MGLLGRLRRARSGSISETSDSHPGPAGGDEAPKAACKGPSCEEGPAAGEAPPPLEPQDSSADPALLAAILESLRTARPDGAPALCATSRFLCRNISQADPEVAGQLRQRRAAQLHTSSDGITYFDPDPESDLPLTLPSFQGYSREARAQALGQLCNEYLQGEAEAAGVLNCVPGCTPLLVLNTQGDGNCLSHACSLGVWGVHDRDSQLRGAIRATMTHPVAGQEIRLRFELQLRQNGIPQEEWAAEWRRELSAFHSSQRMSDRYLSDVHCFTLCNVLRCPLLLYGDEHAALAGLTGVYLPLLWPPSACCRDPVAVLFWGSHFSVLCTIDGEGPAQPQLLPLCTRSGPLQVRFLSAKEWKQHCSGSDSSGGPPLGLLKQYMDCERLPAEAAVWRAAQPERLNNSAALAVGGGSSCGSLQAGCDATCTVQASAPNGKAAAAGCTAEEPAGPGGPALGVRLSVRGAAPQQGLLQLLEAAFVSQAAALAVAEGRRRSSANSLGAGG